MKMGGSALRINDTATPLIADSIEGVRRALHEED